MIIKWLRNKRRDSKRSKELSIIKEVIKTEPVSSESIWWWKSKGYRISLSNHFGGGVSKDCLGTHIMCSLNDKYILLTDEEHDELVFQANRRVCHE